MLELWLFSIYTSFINNNNNSSSSKGNISMKGNSKIMRTTKEIEYYNCLIYSFKYTSI